MGWVLLAGRWGDDARIRPTYWESGGAAPARRLQSADRLCYDRVRRSTPLPEVLPMQRRYRLLAGIRRHAAPVLILLAAIVATPATADLDARVADLVDPDGAPRPTVAPTRDHLTEAMVRPPRGAGNDLDPGVAPEGDYLAWPVFTPDGQTVLMANRATDNVTVFDVTTRTVVANVDVGSYPAGVAVGDQYAVVACAFSDEAWIIDLADFSVAAVIPTAEQPWVVRLNPDQTRAYVACDIPDVCEIIDLETLAPVGQITGFPISLLSFSWGSENGRNGVRFTGFEVTPDGQHVVAGDRGQAVRFFDAGTGALAHTVGGIPDCTTVGLSGDGSTLVALSATDPATAYRIDLAGPALDGSVAVTGYGLSTHQVAVNQDGTKAFLGVNNNSSAFVNFTAGSFRVLTGTYTPFAIGVSPDHAYAIGMQYRFSVLDFDREQLTGQWQGISTSVGAVSPVGATAVAVDPLRSEALNFYDYATPASPQWLGDCVSGLPPEGDAPRRVAITPDGSIAVVANVLSGNVSLVDLATGQVSAILPTGARTQNVAITPDSRWAVACGMDAGSVSVIDLELGEVAAVVPTGQRPGVVAIAPDGSHAYVGNIQGNTVSVIELDGADSSEVAELPCGIIGVSYAAYGISSAVAVSPDGAHCLVAASFDDQIKVIDTATNTIVASLTVGDFPLQIAFDDTGEYATVTNWFGDSISILRLAGAASTVETTVPTSDGPIRLAYDPFNDLMGVAHYYTNVLQLRDPRTGALVGVENYGDFGNLIQADFDASGRPYALTAADGDGVAHFHVGGTASELPAAPSFFALDDGREAAAVVMPGPDHVVVYGADVTSTPRTVDTTAGPGFLLAPGPNPGGANAQIAFRLVHEAEATVSVYDLAGRRIARLTQARFPAGLSRLHWDGRDDRGRLLPAGTYLIELRVGDWRMTRKIARVR
ncbi:beta-propeller fold lactonase family protein [bacterium]|nr:beta-propeller fold lactonase family protein [bacterium]